MKKIFILFCWMIFSLPLYSQNNNKISIYYGFSSNELTRKELLDGAPSYDGKGGNLFGLGYEREIFHNFCIETGLEYSKNSIEITPSFYPEIDLTSRKVTIEILTIPIYANYTFLKYLYANVGALIDFELNREEYDSTDNQSGIGFGLGIGGKYAFNNLILFVNPFYQIHAVIPFNKENYQQHLNELGLKFGIGYNF